MILTDAYQVGFLDTLWPFVFIAIITALLIRFKEVIKTTPLRKWIPILFLGLMLIFEVNYFINIVLIFSRPVQTTMENLPLHMCGSSAILVMLYLGFRKKIFLDILILQGIIGAFVTFIFPDITSFPFTYPYIKFFLAHAILYLVPMYYIIIEDYRVTKRNLVIGLIFIHAVAAVAIAVNLLYDTHYIYISPDNTTNIYAFLPVHEAIPLLGKWPMVFVFAEALAIPVYLGVYHILRKVQTMFD